MNTFINKHQELITGSISVFDRLLFKGYLPYGYPDAAEQFMYSQKLLLKDFKTLVSKNSSAIADYGRAFAQENHRPYEFLRKGHIRKEEAAAAIARQDGISEGLVCVYGTLESNSSFTLRYGEKRPRLERSMPRCLTLYFYFVDREFGLLHIRISTWFPYPIQIYINGHQWLARELDKKGIAYTLRDNAFTWIKDCEKAQKLADTLPHRSFKKMFNRYARLINPLYTSLFRGKEYYWIIDQAEYATDVMFTDELSLKELYTKLQRHVAVCTGAENIMSFLGKKLHGLFNQEISTSLNRRQPGTRVKHTAGRNWIKMYDKFGFVLRIETVINHPYMFKVRRLGKRKGVTVMGYYPMSKGIANLYRFAEVGLSANLRYLEMLSAIDNPSESFSIIRAVCEKTELNGKTVRALNPLRAEDMALFAAVMKGEHSIQGFRHADVLRSLAFTLPDDLKARRNLSMKVSRKIYLLRAHGLIAKVPRSRRYQLTKKGLKIMAASLHLREDYLPSLIEKTVA
jgi:hypothetical protein